MAKAKLAPEALEYFAEMGRQGGKKGGPARAAKLSKKRRSEIARKAVQARWAKVAGEAGSSRHDSIVEKKKNMRLKKSGQSQPAEAASAHRLSSAKKALQLCLKRLKSAKDDNEIRRLTEELQRIVFHRQYENAEN